MKQITLGIVIAIIAFGYIIALPSPAAESSAEENAVRQTADSFVKAFDSGNAEAVAALWTEDGSYSIGATKLKGRNAIAQLYDGFFRTNPGCKMEVKIESIRLLAPTVAIEQGTAMTSGRASGLRSSSAYTAVHVKDGAKWLMTNVTESELPTLLHQDIEELAWLVGDWSAKGDVANVKMKYDWMANKKFLRGETVVHEKDEPSDTGGGMQVIGRDPASGQIVSWLFENDGGLGAGIWTKDGAHWVIQSRGTTIDGAPTFATNAIYHADDNVMSWQSINRAAANQSLPNTMEIVFERGASAAQPKK